MTDATPPTPEILPPASETPVQRRGGPRPPAQGASQAADLNPAGAWRYGVIVCALIIAMPMFSAPGNRRRASAYPAGTAISIVSATT